MDQGRDPIEVILHDDAIPIRQRNPEIPHDVAKVFDRPLSMDPAARFQTAAEFRQALEVAL